VRKSEQITELEENINHLRSNMASLVAKHDSMVVGYRKELSHLDEELRLYTWAFSIACGKLMAHSKTDLTPDEFTAQLFEEARQEMGLL
jgi:hypothetical protein